MIHLPRLKQEDTVLLIVDLQERLVPVMLESERVVKNCATLAATARRLEIPIVVTEQNPAKLGATVEPARSAIGDSAAVAKMTFSAWTQEVQDLLASYGRRTILLCGIEAHICVLQTALDALEGGYTVFGAYDAISARQAWNRQIGWERMRGAGVLPSSTESALFELLGEAGTDDFRALQSLIK
jgi:nicotinamidase-related amidase